MAGYSKTPLFRKLGLKPGMRAYCANPPDNYLELLGSDTPEVQWQKTISSGINFLHLFTKSSVELKQTLLLFLKHMDRDGMVWISWPKKASKVPTDIVEDTIRAECLPLGLVDVKVCAVDDTWSGLKLMIRKELR
ncbi:MAG: hypothetical protein ABJO09_19795 [Hyphomicrobiales bacterium]